MARQAPLLPGRQFWKTRQSVPCFQPCRTRGRGARCTPRVSYGDPGRLHPESEGEPEAQQAAVLPRPRSPAPRRAHLPEGGGPAAASSHQTVGRGIYYTI